MCGLREAINNANSESDTTSGDCAAGTGTDAIVFSMSGTITLGSALPAIDHTVTTDGAGHAIGGASLYQVLSVNSGATLAVDNLTIQYGFIFFGDGGGIQNLGTLTVSNSTFSHNGADDNGGAIVNGNTTGTVGTLTISNSTFSLNSADDAGAIFNPNGTVTICNSTSPTIMSVSASAPS